MLAVNLGESTEAVKAYITRHHLSFPQVLDADGKLAAWFGVRGTPTNFLVNRSGQVMGGGPGYRDWTTPAAHQLIQSLLALDAGEAIQTAQADTARRAADATNAEQVAAGQAIYHQHCAACHGVNLEGQPNWKQPLPTGGLPAPPHDETGHTWHHADQLLFQITKFGGQATASAEFKSNMPAFQSVLSDADIWAVLAFIKSRWPPQARAFQESVNARGK